MPYISRLNAASSLDTQDAVQIAIEFDALRREFDEVRANYNATLAKLDADAGVSGTDYAALNGVAASAVAALAAAPRRFTPT